MENLLITIPFPENSFFENNLKKVKDLKRWIDKQWKLCDEGKLDCDEVSYETEQKAKELGDYFSIYSLVSLLDENIERTSAQQFDVTKIYVSENSYNKMKEHDLKIMKIMYKDVYTDKRINSQVGMLHFSSGFAVKEGLDDDKIYILNDVLKDKRSI